MPTVMPDPSTPFGQRAAQRLREERIIWLTTVGANGIPQPNPVWFLWDGQNVLVYNMPTARRLDHIRRNPRVALHFNSVGEDVVVITGEARVVPDAPLADQNAAYLEKYRDAMAEVSGSAQDMAAQYSVALQITPTHVRGF